MKKKHPAELKAAETKAAAAIRAVQLKAAELRAAELKTAELKAAELKAAQLKADLKDLETSSVEDLQTLQPLHILDSFSLPHQDTEPDFSPEEPDVSQLPVESEIGVVRFLAMDEF